MNIDTIIIISSFNNKHKKICLTPIIYKNIEKYLFLSKEIIKNRLFLRACHFRKLYYIRFLIKYIIDDDYYNIALAYACISNSIKVVKIILENKTIDYFRLFTYQIQSSKKTVFIKLSTEKDGYSYYFYTPNIIDLQWITTYRLTHNMENNLYFMISLLYKRSIIFKILLKDGRFNPYIDSLYILEIADSIGNEKCKKYIIRDNNVIDYVKGYQPFDFDTGDYTYADKTYARIAKTM